MPAGNPASLSRPLSTTAVDIPAGVDDPLTPGQLYIPTIGVNANILSLPTQMAPAPFLGGQDVPSFGVPPDMAQTAWWSDGPAIGAPGMAIIVGHTQVGGAFGVFNNLPTLKPGDRIQVEDRNGQRRIAFQVSAVVASISKRDPGALRQVLATHPPQARLALITCSGEFNSDLGASADNVVVFADRI
ncbi:class F sortase [Skermania sp. ID1734]|nr:class F sortase [Skermania sp. ID1734]